jgi:serine/threonine-protein kinase
MAICHKCNSEIAEDQSFCPFCGVATEDVIEAPADLPDFDNTLNMPFADAVKIQAEQAESPIDLETRGIDQNNGDKDSPVSAPEEKVITNDIAPSDEIPSADVISSGEESSVSLSAPSAENEGKTSGLKPLIAGIVLNSRYEIVRKIGGGGMGAVYLAHDRNLGGVERAVKEMVQTSIEEDRQSKAIEDFKRESMILSSLDHPSIPAIYDYFFDERESRFYLVMKYISGGDLASRLRAERSGRFDERNVCEWALQILDVLDYLHSLPTTIVYRDLKPSNIMVDDKTGRVMIIDFGIARSIDQGREQGVTAVGTMGYAPPELFSGNVEPRSDIYSLGSTMFHLLTGADPQNNPLLIFDFQKNPRPRQINPQLSDQIERTLMRAVEYNADARFSSAAEMQKALTSHLENLAKGSVTYGVIEIPEAVSLANQHVFCGFCGQRIVATDLFCAFCGAKQPIAQQGVRSEIYTRTAATAKLVVDGTSELKVPVFTLEKNDTLLGRRDPLSNIFPEVDLSRFDPQTKISRRHARIWREGGNFLVEDLGSSNGTTIVSSKLDPFRLEPHKPHTLTDGDRIRVGDTTLHFVVG